MGKAAAENWYPATCPWRERAHWRQESGGVATSEGRMSDVTEEELFAPKVSPKSPVAMAFAGPRSLGRLAAQPRGFRPCWGAQRGPLLRKETSINEALIPFQIR